MNDFDELLGRAASSLFVSVGIDEVGTDVVFEHDSPTASLAISATGVGVSMCPDKTRRQAND